MDTKIIDGTKMAERILENVKRRIKRLKITPVLTTILVGDDLSSKVYIKNKKIASEKVGIDMEVYCLKKSIAQNELLDLITRLNDDSKVHGILVQLPLPKHLNEDKIINAVNPNKDVDGLHPLNQTIISPTAKAVMALIDEALPNIEGLNAVVIGTSRLVGKPVVELLLDEEATVTICHKKTRDLKSITKRADILVAAVGIPLYIKPNMVKSGAVVIDVGIHRINDLTTKEGYYLCGDVDFEKVKEKALAITPVPGGVGPVTVAMLLENTLKAYKRSKK